MSPILSSRGFGRWVVSSIGGGPGPYFFVIQQDSTTRQNQTGLAVVVDQDSNIYWSTARYDASYNAYPTITKLSDDGTVGWSTTLNGNTNNILSNLVYANSNLYAFGKYYGGGTPNALAYYAKITPSTGSVVTSSLTYATDYGFSQTNQPRGTVDTSGNIYTYTDVYSSAYGAWRPVLGKLNSSNVKQWGYYSTFSANNTAGICCTNNYVFYTPLSATITRIPLDGSSVINTQKSLDNGNGYLGQNSTALSPDSNGNIYLMNENGNWGSLTEGLVYRWGGGTGGAISGSYVHANTVDKDNNVYYLWLQGNDAYVVKMNSSGTVQWQRKLTPKLNGGTASTTDFKIATDPATGDLVICWAYTSSPYEMALVKLPGDGTLTGTYSVSSGGNSWGFTYATGTLSITAVTATTYSGSNVTTMTTNQSNDAIGTRGNPSFTYDKTTIAQE